MKALGIALFAGLVALAGCSGSGANGPKPGSAAYCADTSLSVADHAKFCPAPTSPSVNIPADSITEPVITPPSDPPAAAPASLSMGAAFTDHDPDDGSVAMVTVSDLKRAKPPAYTTVSGQLFSIQVTVQGVSGNFSPNTALFVGHNTAGDTIEAETTGAPGELSSDPVAAGEKSRGLVYFDLAQGQSIDTVSLTYPIYGTSAEWSAS